MSRSFEDERTQSIRNLGADASLKALSLEWLTQASRHKYSYNFSWLGRPIIQFPQDILAIQELVWKIKPNLIVETGVAHGGSLLLYASLLELIREDGLVVGIDIEIRPPNREQLEQHPLWPRMKLIEGSSLDPAVVATVRSFAEGRRVLVVLDSNHTRAHVLRELQLYSPLVSKGSYVVVCDTIIEDLPVEFFPDRPWSKGNNPKTAVREFLGQNDRFEIDREIQDKLLITVAPDGYLRCIKD